MDKWNFTASDAMHATRKSLRGAGELRIINERIRKAVQEGKTHITIKYILRETAIEHLRLRGFIVSGCQVSWGHT